MKKSLFIGLLALGVAVVGTSFAAAATPITPEKNNTNCCSMKDMAQMQNMHKSMMEQAVKNGTMTADQAKVMDENMKDMCKSMNNDNIPTSPQKTSKTE